MITIDLAIIATALGIIVTIWRFGTVIASVITTNQRSHDKIEYEQKTLKASLERLKRRVSSIEDTIKQHWAFQVRDGDITHNNFEDK